MCSHNNSLPFTSDYMHYCIDCGKTFFNAKGAVGFVTDKDLYRGELDK